MVPITTTAPIVHVKDGEVFANSRDVASYFGKQHKDVLRAIDHLGCSADFTERNFAPSHYIDPTGRSLRSFDMTKDGFTLLVMGYTGAKAMKFKLAYIQAFKPLLSMHRNQHVPTASQRDNPLHFQWPMAFGKTTLRNSG